MRNRGALNLFASIAVILVLTCCALGLTCCAPVYSPYVYDRTAELKTESVGLISKAGEPYGKYSAKIEDLKNDISSLQMQEQLRKRNKIKQKQWSLQTDTAGYLLFGVLSKWQKDSTLSETFISLQKKLIGESFDLIQETEKQYLGN